MDADFDAPPATSSPSSTMLLRLGGWTAVTGGLLMALGAGLWRASGTDLDAALAGDAMAAYLAEAAGNGLVVANLVAWILGVLFLGAAGLAFARAPGNRPAPAHLARVAFVVSVPVAVVAFITWLAMVVQTGSDFTAAELAAADLAGWIASRADWTATALIVVFGPALLSWAGRDGWVPGWLLGLGVLAGVAGTATVVAMFTGALTTYGFAVVPIGLIWMLSAGVTAVRTA